MNLTAHEIRDARMETISEVTSVMRAVRRKQPRVSAAVIAAAVKAAYGDRLAKMEKLLATAVKAKAMFDKIGTDADLLATLKEAMGESRYKTLLESSGKIDFIKGKIDLASANEDVFEQIARIVEQADAQVAQYGAPEQDDTEEAA